MDVARLPDSVSTLYSELLDQALAHERSVITAGSVPGSLVEKTIRGSRYLYWQLRIADRTVQRYLGKDSDALRSALDDLLLRRASLADDAAALDRVAAMVIEGGAVREAAGVATVLRLLAALGLFRRGGVLVGTQAYRAYGIALGVRLPGDSLRTQDIDVAQDLEVAVAAASEPPAPLVAELADLGFLPVPGLDPRAASTSFKVRGRDLRVDFLTPSRARREQPVPVAGMGFSAQPLPFLDYLIEAPIPAVVLAASPVLVRIPRPGRFALHKLWTASERPSSEQAKARKDRSQAAALIDVLAEDRPDDLREAWRALGKRRTARGRIAREWSRLPAAIQKSFPVPSAVR
jgi:hypothetical protein